MKVHQYADDTQLLCLAGRNYWGKSDYHLIVNPSSIWEKNEYSGKTNVFKKKQKFQKVYKKTWVLRFKSHIQKSYLKLKLLYPYRHLLIPDLKVKQCLV